MSLHFLNTNCTEENISIITQFISKDILNDRISKIEITDIDGNIKLAKDDYTVCESWQEFCTIQKENFIKIPYTVRIQRPAHKKNRLSKELLIHQIIGNELPLSLESLNSLNEENVSTDRDMHTRDAVILGSLNLGSIVDAVFEGKLELVSLTVCESSLDDLAALLRLVDLQAIMQYFKKEGIGLTILINTNVDILKQELLNSLSQNNTPSLHGLKVFYSDQSDASLITLEAWLTDIDGYKEFVLGFLGNDTDEINQFCHAIWNSKHKTNVKLLGTNPLLEDRVAVLTASGPSLEESYEWLKENRSQITIFSAGSSLGSLLSNGIKPDFAVMLEMSHLIYDSLISYSKDKSTYKGITLVSPLTLDPRVSGLFESQVIFHRPLSSTMAFFPNEINSSLIQAGPQVANAAFEVIAEIGFKNILLLGVEFSGPSKTVTRVKNALGMSERSFELPMKGRNGKTVFTSPDLSVSAQCLQSAIDYYNRNIYSPAHGLFLENVSIIDLESYTPTNTKTMTRGEITAPFKDRQVYSTEELIKTLSQIGKKSVNYNSALIDLIKNHNEWCLSLSRSLSQYLNVGYSNEDSNDVFIKRMTRFPLFFIIQTLHDQKLKPSSEGQWKSACMVAYNDIDFYFEAFGYLKSEIISNLNNNLEWECSTLFKKRMGVLNVI